MKRRIYKRYRTKKRGGQRYWVGRRLNYGSSIRSAIRESKNILKLLDESNIINQRRTELFNQRQKSRLERRDNLTLNETKWFEENFKEDLDLAKQALNKEIAISEEYSFMSPKEKTEFLFSIEPNPDNWPGMIKNLTGKHRSDEEEEDTGSLL